MSDGTDPTLASDDDRDAKEVADLAQALIWTLAAHNLRIDARRETLRRVREGRLIVKPR